MLQVKMLEVNLSRSPWYASSILEDYMFVLSRVDININSSKASGLAAT